jgi:uncharacterized RDD family membrane protein YckC
MKNIEIKTTQNVVLQYELADLRDRIIAYVIDMAVITIALILMSVVGSVIFRGSETGMTINAVLLFCIFIFYSLAFETLNRGQSLGKIAVRIQVIKTAGGQATFSDYAARWVFRMVDIYFSFGGVASILIASSAKAQRIGDIVANTAVIKLQPRSGLTLKDLLTIHSQSSYSPEYLQAKYLPEEDALLIKATLDRYRKYHNDAHNDALNLLALRVREVLEIDPGKKDDEKFLQTVLKDYVVLTR